MPLRTARANPNDPDNLPVGWQIGSLVSDSHRWAHSNPTKVSRWLTECRAIGFFVSAPGSLVGANDLWRRCGGSEGAFWGKGLATVMGSSIRRTGREASWRLCVPVLFS